MRAKEGEINLLVVWWNKPHIRH